MPELPHSQSRARGLRDRARYHFDNLLARGTWAALVWLGGLTLLAVVFSALLLKVSGVEFAGSEGSSFVEDFWQSLLRVLDTGTMAGDVGVGRRILALIVTVVGILIAGTLIGLIANGVEQRVEAMRRGRSAVIESGHIGSWPPRADSPSSSSNWRSPTAGGAVPRSPSSPDGNRWS